MACILPVISVDVKALLFRRPEWLSIKDRVVGAAGAVSWGAFPESGRCGGVEPPVPHSQREDSEDSPKAIQIAFGDGYWARQNSKKMAGSRAGGVAGMLMAVSMEG